MNYTLIIIIVISILFFLYFNNKRSINYKNIYINNDTTQPSFDNNLDSNFMNPSNKIHFILQNLSREISNQNKINLSGKTIDNLYLKTTINDELLNYVKYIIQNIIKKTIKLKYNNDYYFKDIIEVYQQYDKNGNQRYIIKCFLFELQNFYQVKILLDVVIIKNNVYLNYIGEDLASNLNIINKYDYNIDDVGYLSNRNNIKDNIKDIVDSYYKKYYNIIGYDTSSLEYDHYISKLDTVNRYNIEDLAKYYLPPDIPEINDNNFGVNNSLNWDETGIPYTIGDSLINNNSSQIQPNIPNNYPGSDPTTRNYTGQYDFLQNVGDGNGGNVLTSSWYF